MTRACEDAVYHAWYTFSVAAGTAAKMLVQMGFLFYLGAYEGSGSVLVVLPLLLLGEAVLYTIRVPQAIQLEKEYMRKEEERLDLTNDCLEGRDLMIRYRKVDQASKQFQELHTAEMWARFQFLLYSFNTGYMGKMVPVAAYAVMVRRERGLRLAQKGCKLGPCIPVGRKTATKGWSWHSFRANLASSSRVHQILATEWRPV
jgi:hypothetical protein